MRTAARALAGWVVDRDTNEVRFERQRAFIAPLLFRGKQASFDTEMIVDHLCDDLATAAYVANKLWHHLAGGWMEQSAAIEMGRWWQTQDLEILPLIERIITDGDRVLVATTSEFGRRVAENDRGLDHGAASTMLLAGPIASGRFGVAPPVAKPDGNGNLATDVPFDSYLATLAQDWLGIEAASVLPNDPERVKII